MYFYFADLYVMEAYDEFALKLDLECDKLQNKWVKNVISDESNRMDHLSSCGCTA